MMPATLVEEEVSVGYRCRGPASADGYISRPDMQVA
jgi:hypothetical protein